jgi:cyclic beta-1,2-glucan synthetase
MPDDNKEQGQGRELSTSDKSLTSTTDQVQILVNALIDNYQIARREIPIRELRAMLQGRDLAGRNLKLYESWLAEAHSHFRAASNRDLTLTFASEWVLDNYYIIRQALQQIIEDLPHGYYKQLPKLTSGPLKGLPRIYPIARAILSYQQYLLNPIDLQTILIQLQDRVPLTMGELWALPIFLRYSCIETLAHELERVIHPQNSPHLPVSPPQLPGTIEINKANQAPADDRTVANIILSLRGISEQNWNDFFESVSRLERILREDPSGIYPRMDFKTRDLYRKEIESLSFVTGREENELAEITLDLARKSSAAAQPGSNQVENTLDDLGAHIGEYLLGKSRVMLEERIGYHPGVKTALERWGFRHASTLYLGSIMVMAVLIFILLAFVSNLPVLLGSASLFQRIVVLIEGLILLVPVLTAAASLTNWLVTLRIHPYILPKLHFKEDIPPEYQTLVVIPALITGCEEVDNLTRQLEMHYLRNPEPGLLFALLTDFRDADSETLPEDDDLLTYAAAAVENLNAKYKPSSPSDSIPGTYHSFYLLHRKRLWNQSEGKWMGWERKRGKLHELNLLLRGMPHNGTSLSFSKVTNDMGGLETLKGVRFVITLDADTVLPRGAARRLAGTLAHPLNRAKFNDTTGQVISGYTVLQPRMEINPRSANYSWFTRIFAGDTGLDLYTRAVSDAYQDLFGEGSYVGKGIYDVDAFARSVDQRIPENTILSHDLLEGIMGRAGLVTDITMIEDYPPSYFVQVMRQRRWIRGDWQLLPWLLHPHKFRIVFSAIDRWKMSDNLLRSMLVPALFLIFGSGLLFLPELAGVWLAIILISLGIPLLTSMARSALQTLGGENLGVAFSPLGSNLMRLLLAIVFLPYEAYVNLDAIFTTLHRLAISHRDLLQWTTAAQTTQLFDLQAHRNAAWLKMSISGLFSLSLVSGMQIVHEFTGTGVAPALVISSPILLLWLFAPVIAQWISQPIKVQKAPLQYEQGVILRQVVRRTWGFFERFVGPEDHWLPPDHFQESPVGIIAHRTSPSNIGLLLTSTLAAYDFGYLDQLGLVTRLSTTLDTLGQLERFRGHFLNWYETLTLQPLHPRYISTVDSGNLAASLIITAQACKTMPDQAIFRWDLWQGYLDTLSNLSETLSGMRKAEFDQQVEEINRRIAAMHAKILVVRGEPERWYAVFQSVSGPFWQDLSNRLMKLVEVGRSAFDLETLRKLQEVSAQAERLHLAVQRTLAELLPWIPLLEQPPALFSEIQFLQAFNTLRANLPYNPLLNEIRTHARAGLSNIIDLRGLLTAGQLIPFLDTGQEHKAIEWLDGLDQALTQASVNAAALIIGFSQIAASAEQYVNEMDFQYLYHPQRRVFHIGFNLDSGEIDNNYYDLLASEARIASIIALAKGEVPQSHWLQLGRPLTRVEGMYVLLSWSATMFEYLMPPLFLRSYPGTLLADSAQGAVLHQIAYGKAKDVPWGISESGFYRFDANQNYQYRAFGVPGLGFKRGLGDDLVIAPYASLMAIRYNPRAVAQNLANLIENGSFGLYGLYESIDFTADRLLADDTSMVVHEYMTHHQGMILMALVNYFHNDIMVQRMHSDPRIQSVELLLQEQVPQAIPLQNPYAEDVKGIRRLTATLVEINPWSVPLQTPIPQVNLLSNGDYNLLLSNMGGGYSSWRNIDLTRWQPDGVLDPWGTWIYIQDLKLASGADADGGGLWSAGFQPVPGSAENMTVTYFAHMAVFRRTENGITSTLEVTVSPNDPVEVRRIHLHNTSSQPRHLRLTSYGEVILSQQAADSRHPAFNKLFIESEFVPELDLQIFMRRPRSDQETPIYMGHMLVVEGKGALPESQPTVRHEADRNRFIGRGRTLRSPAALFSEQYLTGTTGATLDAIFALGQEVEINPHESVELAYLTFAGDDREAILALARRYRTWDLIVRSFHQANIAAQTWLGKENYTTQVFKDTLKVLSALLYPFKEVRALPAIIAANKLSQSGLWRFGISGDYPILLVELEDPNQVELVREVLQVYEFLRSRRFMVDIVILNHQQTDYGDELNGMLYRLVSRLKGEQWLNQRGGIFILFADQMNPEERTLLQTAGRVLLTGERVSLDDQMPIYPIQVHHLPKFIRTLPIEDIPDTSDEDPLPLIAPLQFFNGYGGFTRDGREYIIDLPHGKPTPAPWINVIGYPNFGFMVSEAGSQSTWAVNSGENRLTPWSNDPVCDPTGEALYLRDEETGDVWTPTPLPAGTDRPYRVTHGAGYTIFEHNSHGLRQRLTLFASPEDPVKIIHLRVKNTWDHTRRITATQYVEWVLGTTHAAAMQYIIPEYDAAEACLLAANPYSAEFGERVAFLIASKAVHGLTADRVEFFGRGGTAAFPAALRRIGLETRITPGEDPCAVLQMHLDLLPGAVEEIYFVLGQGINKEEALALAKKYHGPAYVGAALERTRVFWDGLLDKIQIHTPQPATDLILNRWMLYQSLSCRIWGRSAFYQPSGAFGFRDQLQDVLALLPIDPGITRGQILNAAQYQFEEGDVMHWWHPPSGRGVRTRISDDLLWLPYVTALYVEATGDASILEEKIPFLQAPPLNAGENERYDQYPQTREVYSLIEHCHRAIAKSATRGAHDLPLIGTGDWNDGLNRVGEGGKGESVWLGWFLIDVLDRFGVICGQNQDPEAAQRYQSLAREYAAAIEKSGWDGTWYRRAYYDDGTTLGSSQDSECQIDAIAQSWAVLSGAGAPDRSQQAMQSVLQRLIYPQDRLSLLFTPPFDASPRDPGYIKGYLPGIRENGGQYTHAATWTAWAFAQLGDGRQAGELFDMLNPIFH